MAKETLTKHTTPAGTAVWPKVNKPDTKFKEDGEYSIGLSLPEQEAQPLIDVLMPILDEFWNTEYNKLKAVQKKTVKKHLPWKPELDPDTEEETGNVIFSFKTAAKFKDKNGNFIDKKLPLFGRDAKETDKLVYYGSTVKVNFSPKGFTSPVGGGMIGLTLYLNAVQVLKFAAFNSAASFAFTAEEGDDGTEEAGEDSPPFDAGASGENEDF